MPLKNTPQEVRLTVDGNRKIELPSNRQQKIGWVLISSVCVGALLYNVEQYAYKHSEALSIGIGIAMIPLIRSASYWVDKYLGETPCNKGSQKGFY